MFSPEIQAAIEEARGRLTVTQDGTGDLGTGTLRVDGLANDCWMIFTFGGGMPLRVTDMASNIRYNITITGKEGPPWWEVSAAWEIAREALNDLSKVLPTRKLTPNRVTHGVAAYLAMKRRIDDWGGFTGERNDLPRLFAGLTEAERQAVADRLAGKVVT